MQVRTNRYIPFSYKMMLPYLLLVMLTDIVIGYFSYSTALQSRTELVESNSRSTLQQMTANVSYKMRDLQEVADSLFSSLSFQDYLQVRGEDFAVYETTSRYMLPLLDTAVRMSIQELRLIVYVKNPYIDEIYTNIEGPITDKSRHILSYSRIADSDWYQQTLQTGEDNLWRQVGTDQADGNISLIRKLISFDDFDTEIGYLRVGVPLYSLFLSEDVLYTNDGTLIRVWHEDGSNRHMLIRNTTAQDTATPDESEFLSITERIGDTGYVLEMLVPRSTLTKDSGQIAMITTLVCLVSFLVIAGVAFIIAKYSGRKMLRIVSYVRAFQLGRLERRIPFDGHDEFSQIAVSFNQMARRIEELIQEVYEQGMKQKEKELQALQAQINPHFLYNTLSSINSLANIGETEKLSEMVAGLTKFYRLTLNDGKLIVPLQDEINQVKAYLDIQAIKYANRFTVSFDIDPACEKCHTVKLILQPFVENIFKHAWYSEKIHIRITAAKEGDHVVLKVIDDGLGMSRATLENIWEQQPEEEGGYGIRNVRDRIVLQYGSEYGVEIMSRYGIGTAVRITIPYTA